MELPDQLLVVLVTLIEIYRVPPHGVILEGNATKLALLVMVAIDALVHRELVQL